MSNKNTRTQNSFKNTFITLIGHVLFTLISFVSRKVFLTFLGDELIGLNGVFTDIISVLSLVELGIGSAIIYSLYKPLAKDNKEEVKSIMAFYKKVYTIIGIIIIVIGVIMLPFLNVFIKENISIVNIKFVFLFFVANTALTYFLSYKRSLLSADQKQYVINMFHHGISILVHLLQMLILYLTKNYYLYLTITILGTIAENIFINKRVLKLYPYILIGTPSKLSEEKQGEITKNTTALLMHKIAGKVVNSTDGIIISTVLGVVVKGFYDNYNIVFSAIRLIVIQVFDGFTASIGNIHITESAKKSKIIFDQMLFANFWIAGFSTVALFNLLGPLIYIWLGEKYILSSITLFLLCTNFYFTMIRQTALVFRRAYGLYWEDRHKAILEAIVNLVFSVVLVKVFGLNGVIVGTIISNITVCIWIEPLVMYKNIYKTSLLDYFKRFIPYTIVTFIALFLNKFILDLLKLNYSLPHFLLKIIVTALTPNILFLLVFFNIKEFKGILSRVKNFLSKKTLS